MTYQKPISGHTGCRGVMKYLEKGGRALAHDFVNCSERADDFWKRDWAKQMDDMREWAGTKESRNGQRTST